jgi:tRNA threonylcarbamoyl adenosine modification protein YjeE
MALWDALLPNEAATLALGRRLGGVASAGDVIALHGNLGAGKTCFARGFAAGLQVPNLREVTSPTFALWHIHEGGMVTLHHLDLYRLAGPDEAFSIGLEDVLGGDGVCLVEWPGRAPELFPSNAVHLTLSVAPEGRHASLTGLGERAARYALAASMSR